jgi:hypothetical protein
VRAGRERHDARVGSGEQPVQQQPREREVAEVVRPELHLEAVRRRRVRRRHQPGVVHEQVERLVPGAREGPDAVQGRQVEAAHVDLAGHPGGAARPFSSERTASVTRAPARASSRAATRPMPEFAPVTMTRRPAGQASATCSIRSWEPPYGAVQSGLPWR